MRQRALAKETDLYTPTPAYPSGTHEEASHAVLEHFRGQPQVKAILLTNSCARGKATRDSCLDMLIVLPHGLGADETHDIERRWKEYRAREPVFAALERVGRFSEIDLEFGNAAVHHSTFHHGWTTGPDHFELEIGNTFAYSLILWEADSSFRALRDSWLPYYDESLRITRLAEVRRYFQNNLDHVEPYVGRGLYFAAHKRIFNAFGELLQALFIARKIYPIAYDKHVREQVVEMLGLESLYRELTGVFEIGSFESRELVEKSRLLAHLMEMHVGKGA